jgi:hypothetical protein
MRRGKDSTDLVDAGRDVRTRLHDAQNRIRLRPVRVEGLGFEVRPLPLVEAANHDQPGSSE